MSKTTDVEKVKHLRESTGLSFNEIKKALDEAGGDETKAVEILRVRGVKMAEKKSSREVKEGVVASYVHATKKLGSMVEILCETDFVARNTDFQELAKEIAMHIAAMKPGDVAGLLEQPYVKNPDMTVKDLVNNSVAKLGENIQVGRFEIFQI
ncbi:MAG: translation elongation factor Ts [Candidatus Yanofskybacteria bacterium]|nr:translation elongation factor Ts [Candidatus Yanofskybacteria bacterium]